MGLEKCTGEINNTHNISVETPEKKRQFLDLVIDEMLKKM